MNCYRLFLLSAVIMTIIAASTSAHPARDLNLTYNQTSGNLSATFTHEVADPVTHYIEFVTIFLDGEETLVEEYTSQPTAEIFTYEYPLNATPKTEIELVADCVLGGTAKKSLIV